MLRINLSKSDVLKIGDVYMRAVPDTPSRDIPLAIEAPEDVRITRGELLGPRELKRAVALFWPADPNDLPKLRLTRATPIQIGLAKVQLADSAPVDPVYVYVSGKNPGILLARSGNVL